MQDNTRQDTTIWYNTGQSNILQYKTIHDQTKSDKTKGTYHTQ